MTLEATANPSETLNDPTPAPAPAAPAPAAGDPPAGGAPSTASPETPPATTGPEKPWQDQLSPDLKINPVMQRFQTPDALAKSYLELNKVMSGGNRDAHVVTIPANEDEKAWTELYGKLGRPETSADYKLEVELPETLERDEGLEKVFRDSAHKHGLSAKQAQGLFKDFITAQVDRFNTSTAAHQQSLLEAETALKTEWGAAYEQKLQTIGEVLGKYSTDSFKTMLDETGLGNNVEMLRFVDQVVRALGDDTIDTTGSGAHSQVMTPADATAAINQKYADAEFSKAYRDKTHPSHAAAVEEMSKLFKLRAGVKA